MSKSIQRITPFLWFDNQAEEAAIFYTSIFKNSKIERKVHGSNGTVLTVAFELDGQKFAALNGGPVFKFTEAVSFVVNCETQEEIDEYWAKLSAGGKEVECGWLKDKFGLSWQIVPADIGELLGGGDAAKSQRAMAALMKMKKLDIAALRNA